MAARVTAVIDAGEIAVRFSAALRGGSFSPADILEALAETAACVLAVHIRAEQSSAVEAAASVEWIAQETLKRLNNKLVN